MTTPYRPHALEEDNPFLNRSVGTKHGTAPVSVKVRPVVDEILKTLPDKSGWIRSTIEDRLIAEGRMTKIVRSTEKGEVVEYFACNLPE